ncbi:MAG: hypothetical protein HXS48_06240 [Theionarchaea archaeon]|nr:hypothetical protein [Theionarchaea archaeon]
MKEHDPENHKKETAEGADSVKGPQNELPEIICPVCGNVLEPYNVPTKELMLEELHLLFKIRTRIIRSKATLEYEFAHACDEPMGEKRSHPLTAVIRIEFDDKGKCTAFNIVDVRPGKRKRKKKWR